MSLLGWGANRRTDRLGNVTVDVTVAMREEDHRAIRKMAEEYGCSVSALMRMAVWDLIKKGERNATP